MRWKRGFWVKGSSSTKLSLSLTVGPHGLPGLVKVAWEPTMCQALCETKGLQPWVTPGSQSFIPGPHLSHSIQVKKCYWEGCQGQMNLEDIELNKIRPTSSPHDSLESLILSLHILDCSQRGPGMQHFPIFNCRNLQVQHLKTPILPGTDRETLQ